MLEQGQVIADYKVIRQLAEYDCRHEYLVTSAQGEQKLVQFRESAGWSRSQRQAFHDQVKSLSGLNLPAAAVPIRALDQEGELYCIYPLPAGSPLQKALTGERSARAAVELTRAIVAIIESAHRQQFFHGGLSPDTIYLEQGQPRLTDFSLASLVTFDYRSVAEVEYASPEQIRGESPSIATDIYSLGCVFYALLTGRAPFTGDDAFTVGMQHLNDSLPEVPPALGLCSDLLHGMTRKTAGERLTIEQVSKQLNSLLSQDELDQVPLRTEMEVPPAAGDDDDAEQARDAMEMVSRIEKQLRELESSSAAMSEASDDRQQEEDLPVASSSSSTGKTTPSANRSFFLVIGVVIGFCLGALSFDFFLARPDPVVTPQIHPLTAVPPDFDSVARLWLEGDLTGAEQELDRLLTNFPDHPQIYNNLAAVAAARGEIERAQSWLEQAIVLDTQAATIYRNLSEVYAEMARDSYGRALQLDQPGTTLQLNLFSNRGVISRPSGADTVVARTVAGENQGSAVPESADQNSPVAVEPVVDVDNGDTVAVVQQTEPDEIETTGAAADTATATEAGATISETETMQAALSDSESVSVAETEPDAEETTAEETTAEETTAETEPVAAASGEDPVDFLKSWAAAWSAQDVEKYLSFYSDDFIPAGGLDQDEWVAQRRERLQRPDDISVTLVDIDLREEVDGLLQVEVIQDYQSERYSDRTRKLFDLRRKSDEWEIERERSLELIYR